MREHYHHGDLRSALLAETLAALDRDGVLPSWRALARACGVSQSAPYRHFEDFEALRAAVAAASFDELRETVAAAVAQGADPWDRLARGCRAYIDFGVRHPARYRLMFGISPGELGRHAEAFAAGRAAFALLVRAVGECGVDDPTPVAYAAWAATHGVVVLHGAGLGPDAGFAELATRMILDHARASRGGGR